MSLEIIIGKNKSGKTKYLEKHYDNTKDDKVLFIPAEAILSEHIKSENVGTKLKPEFTAHWKILNFINKIMFGNNFKIKFDDAELNKINQSRIVIENFNRRVAESDDIFFENFFRNFLSPTDVGDVYAEHNFLNREFKPKDITGSSGSLNYSLIKFLYEVIMDENFNIEQGFTLVIDEIEKFSHPEMIFKIADMIIEVSKKINVVLTTHSPLFLERIFFVNKRDLENNANLSITYKIKRSFDEEKIFELNKEIFCEILKNNNYREIMNISKVLFSTNIFFIEGLNDHTLINDIINNNAACKVTYYTVIDCWGKPNIKKMCDNLKNLGINDFYNICLFYDKDRGDRMETIDCEKNVFEIVNDPDIEERLFEVKWDIVEKKYKNGRIVTKTREIPWTKKSDMDFSKEWISKNSTRNNVVEEIKYIESEIVKFLSKPH